MLSLEATHGGGTHRIGDDISALAGDVVTIAAEAGSYVDMQRVELLIDGQVVATLAAPEGVRHAAVSHEFAVQESCWIALRAAGAKDERVMDDYVFAHTSPIYVTVDGAPQRSADDAAYFIDWIDRLIAMTEREGRFESDADREASIAEFRAGQDYYRAQLGTSR
jgi:hypothetical protein